MEYDVTIDRDKFIGGSDIPVIMGISSFKTRWELLQEKAGLKESTFTGNKYTEYGKVLEPKIRDYINEASEDYPPFEPNRVIDGDFRAHTDGFDGGCVLEIKTTSHIYETVDEYKVYLVQLVKYMEVNKVERGVLAVYERPEDFNTDLNLDLLRIHCIALSDYTDLLAEVNAELDRFRSDLERLKENPLLSEQDFQPTELVALSQKVVAFENQLAEMKVLEAELKKAKQELYEAMEKHGVKSWSTPNGTKITMVAATPASVETVTEFDEKAFKAENEGLYSMYLHTVEKKKSGRAGYVKVALPKES
jgi:putative phage-type endonuclease